MTDETETLLDDLLVLWHHSCMHYRVTRGWASRSAGMGQYRASRQYDDTNGALDEQLTGVTIKAVEFQVSEMAEPFKSAIHANAKNLASGCRVWSSPRLPESAMERTALISQARSMLLNRLHGAGVL